MRAFYLEPSALLKRYKSELGSEVVVDLFDFKSDDELFVTSHLSILDIMVVGARLLRGGAIRAAQHQRLIGTFLSDLDHYGILVLPVDDALVTAALELLPDHPLRAADALHVATARGVSQVSDTQDFQMVTADRELGATCSSIGIAVVNPEHPSARDQLRAARA